MPRVPLLLVLLLVVACEQQPAAPASDEVPSLDWMNNPDDVSPKVFRDANHGRVCWADPETWLAVCHTTIPLGSDPQAACEMPGMGEPLSNQNVGTPDFFRSLSQGELWVVIVDLKTPGDCLGAWALVARGWGRFTYTDNNTATDLDFSANATWRFTGHGRLEAPDGTTMIYDGHSIVQVGRNFDYRVLSRAVNLH